MYTGHERPPSNVDVGSVRRTLYGIGLSLASLSRSRSSKHLECDTGLRNKSRTKNKATETHTIQHSTHSYTQLLSSQHRRVSMREWLADRVSTALDAKWCMRWVRVAHDVCARTLQTVGLSRHVDVLLLVRLSEFILRGRRWLRRTLCGRLGSSKNSEGGVERARLDSGDASCAENGTRRGGDRLGDELAEHFEGAGRCW